MNALDHLHEYGVLSRRAQRLANLLAEIIPSLIVNVTGTVMFFVTP